MFIVSRPIRREIKLQKMTGKQQQGSVTTWYETTSWPFFFYKKSSMFRLDLSEKAIFWLKNQHQSLDSVCSKTKLPNRPKSECKLWKFTTAKVEVIGKGLLATKNYASKATNHSQLSWPFELYVKQTPRSIACDWLIFSCCQTRCLVVWSCLPDWLHFSIKCRPYLFFGDNKGEVEKEIKYLKRVN